MAQIKSPRASVMTQEEKKLKKTQLCANFMKGLPCPWGNDCGFAHGESELRFQGLVAAAKEGILDIETFRTRPCLTHVATGSCPFEDRCESIHDPRLTGNWNYWLPHCKRSVKSLDTSSNIDYHWFSRMLTLHHGTPAEKHLQKVLNDEKNGIDRWNDLYKEICNIKSQSESASDELKGRFNNTLTYCQMLQIVLKLRQDFSHLNRRKFLLTHIVHGEPCMVVQSRYFELISRTCVRELSATSYNSKNGKHINVHEIAFGFIGENCKPAGIWCGIKNEDIISCTEQQMKRFKRTKVKFTNCKIDENKSREFPSDSLEKFVSCGNRPFYMTYPADKDCFDLFTNVIELCLKQVELITSHLSKENKKKIESIFNVQYLLLKKKYQSLENHWSLFTWPVNHGREIVDETTMKPDVDVHYNIPEKTSNKPPGRSSLHSNARIWNSFCSTISHMNADAIDTCNDFDCGADTPKGCNIFNILKKGLPTSYDTKNLPMLAPPVPITNPEVFHILSESERCWRDIFLPIYYNAYQSEWDKVKAHYIPKTN